MQIDDEIPLLLMSIYLFRCTGACSNTLVSGIKLALHGLTQRPARETKSGGEFGWGGTSVKR
jgi:hypothetical protein